MARYVLVCRWTFALLLEDEETSTLSPFPYFSLRRGLKIVDGAGSSSYPVSPPSSLIASVPLVTVAGTPGIFKFRHIYV